MIDNFKDKKVLIVGLGRAGVAAARYAASRGACVTVSEKKDEPQVREYVSKLKGFEIVYSFGKNDPALMMNSDLIVLSPGVPLNIDGLKQAKRAGVPVVNELELAVCEIKTPMIAVTGTNGKTTTATLIGHLLTECGIKNCVGGNIGTALTDLINDAKGVDWVVVEVSSFQLETTPSLAPKIGVLLNVTPDHLDRHESFEEYLMIKAKLFDALNKEGWGIYNSSDSGVAGSVKKSRARLIPFNPNARLESGGWFENGVLSTDVSGKAKNQYRLDNVRLKGSHNRENMLASVIVAELCGADRDKIQRGLESFKGLPHRIEYVGLRCGVKYYDDSKGTNVGATVAALENFSGPVILIAGGVDKGGSYEPLAPLIRERVRLMVLIGKAKDKMKAELGNLTDTVFADTLEGAVEIAADRAKAGDVVLLSPACASFDMFRDYAHRGEVFA